MFGFGRKKLKTSTAQLSLEADPPRAAPIASTKISDDDDGERLLQLILVGLADDRGVSTETALVTLGALAGFSVQMAVRQALVDTGRLPPGQGLIKIECKNGDVFYTGDILNPPLLQTDPAHTSVFRMTAEAAHAIGARTFPDLTEMVRHMAESYGEDHYGMPRVPAANLPHHAPRDLLRDSWDTVAVYLRMQDQGDPLRWPYWIGTVIQKLVRQAARTIDPLLVTPLVMEPALAMSRVDPATIVGRSQHDGSRAIDLARTDLGKLLQSRVFGDLLEQAIARERP